MSVEADTFVMKLSQFDSSHHSDVPGTSEILIPLEAKSFFPELKMGDRGYPDVYFDVLLNTSNGKKEMNYRLWYYEERAVGTKIYELRLRTNHETIDLTNSSGGDILVITKSNIRPAIKFEISIISSNSKEYKTYLSRCDKDSQGKKWGIY